jgi:DNA-binding response OmpR family regulator
VSKVEGESIAEMAKHRVLVIDDDPGNLQLLGLIFERANYEVHLAESGSAGLSQVDDVQPDLVVLDVMMPEMNGLEVCERLRAQASTAHLPIIILSGKGQVDDKIGGFKAGADDYVRKPVEPKELLARARALLEQKDKKHRESAGQDPPQADRKDISHQLTT